MHGAPVPSDLPVADTLEHFDPNAGSRLERLVFNNRRLVIVACALLTVLLGAVAVIKLAWRELRKDDPAGSSVHPELPRAPH